MNTDFEITPENEHEIFKDFLTGQQKATEVIKSEVSSLKTDISETKKADHAEIQATRNLIQTREEELNKVELITLALFINIWSIFLRKL